MAFKDDIIAKCDFELTQGQNQFILRFQDFLYRRDASKPIFILKGYAGTGKTTMISLLVDRLEYAGWNVVLLAPTGRAAKVMSGYAHKDASTIHRHIYRTKSETNGSVFVRKRNNASRTIYIVDEASMISDQNDFGTNGLLKDLIDFVFEKNTNKLVLVGDTAQLPPVNLSASPALDEDYMESTFLCDLIMVELTEVVRQERKSGILYNATQIRNQLLEGEDANIKFSTRGFPDIYKMNGDKLEDGLRYAYQKYGEEDTILITRSNKSATGYNRYIRFQIKSQEEEISAGDLIMVVKNNYQILPDDIQNGFLANGDFLEVMKVKRIEEMYGYRFADIELRLVDHKDQYKFDAKVMLDTLYSNTASMSYEEQKKLFELILEDYKDLSSKSKQIEAVKKDSYYNALQIKFAYALTCHKSQGGQWGAVFVDQGYLTEDMINEEYLRWLYTALTRASKELFLVNFNEKFY